MKKGGAIVILFSSGLNSRRLAFLDSFIELRGDKLAQYVDLLGVWISQILDLL